MAVVRSGSTSWVRERGSRRGWVGADPGGRAWLDPALSGGRGQARPVWVGADLGGQSRSDPALRAGARRPGPARPGWAGADPGLSGGRGQVRRGWAGADPAGRSRSDPARLGGRGQTLRDLLVWNRPLALADADVVPL
nr:hypothetical protein GCM10020063_085310 [Dactylosporangium thailandense]